MCHNIPPKISVIVPCYGVEKYLDRCLSSLVRQSLVDIEIILVDDCSPDKVPLLCDKWAKRINVSRLFISNGMKGWVLLEIQDYNMQ